MNIGIDGNEANQRKLVGIGQFASGIINGLERLDQKNHYFIYLKEPPITGLPKERPGWKYQVFGPGKFWTQIGLPLNLYIQRIKLDLFFSPSHYAPRFSPVPTVISVMDLWHHHHPEQFEKKDLYQLINWEKYSVRNSSAIITISEFSKSEIIKFYNYPPERITVAYPGYSKFQISNSKFQINSQIQNTKNKYKIKGDYLLYLGTLQPKKNLEGLIEAFAMVVGDRGFGTSDQESGVGRNGSSVHQSPVTGHRSPITLVIAGKKGWLFETIFNKVKELGLEGKVIFTDFIEENEKPFLISGAKGFVLASFYEGFGIPVVEAMSLGIPVAISRVSSLPEVGGKTAFYFNPENPKEIAQSLLEMIKLGARRRRVISQEGQKQAGKFNWETCAKKTLEVFEKVSQKKLRGKNDIF